MINLLPQKVKLELRQEQKFRLLSILLFSFTVALVCFALMLSVIKVYGVGALVVQESRIASLQERFSKGGSVLGDIEAFNETTSQVSRFFKSSRSISVILQSLEEILPAGLYLTAFDYDPPGVQAKGKGQELVELPARISVSGFASTREALFAFRESLEKHPRFSDLSFPASNWVLPQDIRFSFQVSIKP